MKESKDDKDRKYYATEVRLLDERINDDTVSVDQRVRYYFEKASLEMLLGWNSTGTRSLANGIELIEMLNTGVFESERK